MAIAEMYSLPILDLSRTFDPFDRSHYGSTEIEPSNISGQFICDLVKFIVEDFNWEGGDKRKSKLYYGGF